MTILWRMLYRLERVAARMRYATRRRFTGTGKAVLGALVITAAMGMDTENTVAYQAFTFVLAMLFVAACLSLVFRGRFAATRLLPRFGTAGQPFGYSVCVTNRTAKTQRDLVLLENLEVPQPSFEDWHTVQIANEKRLRSFRLTGPRVPNPFRTATVKESALPPVRPHDTAEVRVELTPLRRGVLRFSGMTLARPDPLGMVRAFARVSLPQSVLILPKRYVLPPVALPGTARYQQGGVAQASHVGQSEEFMALRDYRHGDPWRHIHWRSWAKVGQPVVKEFEDEFFVRHALVLDTFTDEPYGDVFEEAVSVAASFACTVLTQESLLDLLFVGTQSFCFTAGRGLAHTEQMLQILASAQACRNRPFGTLEHLVLNHARLVSGCICVLLAWDEARRSFVEKLRALGVPLLVMVIVGSGQSRELDPGPLRDEPERLRVLEIGRIEEQLAMLG